MRAPFAEVRPATVTHGAVTTKAVLRAAGRLGVSNKVLGRIIGVSDATVSRMGSGTHTLSLGDKPFELAVLFIRMFRSLDAMVAGDEAAASAWLKGEKWPFPVMADSPTGTGAEAYGLTSYPYFVLVNADGTVAGRGSGELPEDQIKANIEALKAGKDLPITSSDQSSSAS